MNTQEIISMGDSFVMRTYGRIPLALVKGEGCLVWDAEGKEYLDFVSGIAVCALGHCHPRVVKAIREQVETLIHISNLYYIEPQVKLAKMLVDNSCADKVFFCNSGAESNEAAIKLARKYAKLNYGKEKYEIITALHSFHGRTLAAITATGQPKYQKNFEPLPQGFKYVPYNDLDALKEAVSSHTCAVMLEPIQGEGGVHPAEMEYLKGARKLCDELGLLLIFDEIQTGMGRSGKLFAYEHYQVEPDIFTLAKALGGGFPIGAMLAKDKVASCFEPGDHASTFGGNPLACAAGLASIEELLNGVVDNAYKMGLYFKKRLEELKAKFPVVEEVRGKGLLLGMQVKVPGKQIVDNCQKKGLLINCVGQNILRFVPPLIIKEKDVDCVIDILAQELSLL